MLLSCMTDYLADAVLQGHVNAAESARQRMFEQKEKYSALLTYSPVLHIAGIGLERSREILKRALEAFGKRELKLPARSFVLEFSVNAKDECEAHHFVVDVSTEPDSGRFFVIPYVAPGREIFPCTDWYSGYGAGIADPADAAGYSVALCDLKAKGTPLQKIHDRIIGIGAEMTLRTLWCLQHGVFDVSYEARRPSWRVERHMSKLRNEDTALPPLPSEYGVLRMDSRNELPC